MGNRREFLKLSGLGALTLLSAPLKGLAAVEGVEKRRIQPTVISTWNHGLAANKKAWEIISAKGSALDAVEAGVMVTESDPESRSVGLGGLPDKEGKVTLDACIMDHNSNCGAVAFLQKIENPIAVARKVMEKTQHVMLVGKGALDFALDNGFKKTNLLTKQSKADWKKWKKEQRFQPKINSENHDTIGLLAIDQQGNISGACTTSGMAYKLHGRVGDSPIIGAGLFVDNEVGGAVATGVGEAVIRVAGSAMVVELMRQGKSPQEACETIVNRIISKHKELKNLQVGFLAMNKSGEVGAFSVYKGFNYAYTTSEQHEMKDAGYDRNW